VVARLTPREREVAQLAALGLADRAIADQLTLSVRTVETHLNRAYTKLGLQGRTDLTSVFAATTAD
jgi:DNA-binding NarL/FixJ family response regulator